MYPGEFFMIPSSAHIDIHAQPAARALPGDGIGARHRRGGIAARGGEGSVHALPGHEAGAGNAPAVGRAQLRGVIDPQNHVVRAAVFIC